MMKEKEREERKISSFFFGREGGWPGFGPTWSVRQTARKESIFINDPAAPKFV